MSWTPEEEHLIENTWCGDRHVKSGPLWFSRGNAHQIRTSGYGEKHFYDYVREVNTRRQESPPSSEQDTKSGIGDSTKLAHGCCISSLARWMCTFHHKCRDTKTDQIAGLEVHLTTGKLRNAKLYARSETWVPPYGQYAPTLPWHQHHQSLPLFGMCW